MLSDEEIEAAAKVMEKLTTERGFLRWDEAARAALSAAARVRAEANAEGGEPEGELCKCAPAFHEHDEAGAKHCRSCDAEWHPAPQPSGPVEDLLDEGLEILNALIDNIKRCGNYSPDATCTFIDQAGQCLREALSALTAGKPEQAVPSEAEAERERIAKALEEEADTTPCSEDAVVVRDCARLVRANFSYGEAERLASTTADIAAPTAGGGDA